MYIKFYIDIKNTVLNKNCENSLREGFRNRKTSLIGFHKLLIREKWPSLGTHSQNWRRRELTANIVACGYNLRTIDTLLHSRRLASISEINLSDCNIYLYRTNDFVRAVLPRYGRLPNLSGGKRNLIVI